MFGNELRLVNPYCRWGSQEECVFLHCTSLHAQYVNQIKRFKEMFRNLCIFLKDVFLFQWQHLWIIRFSLKRFFQLLVVVVVVCSTETVCRLFLLRGFICTNASFASYSLHGEGEK